MLLWDVGTYVTTKQPFDKSAEWQPLSVWAKTLYLTKQGAVYDSTQDVFCFTLDILKSFSTLDELARHIAVCIEQRIRVRDAEYAARGVMRAAKFLKIPPEFDDHVKNYLGVRYLIGRRL